MQELNDELVFLTTLLEDQTVRSSEPQRLCARHRYSFPLNQKGQGQGAHSQQGTSADELPFTVSLERNFVSDNQNKPADTNNIQRTDQNHAVATNISPLFSSVPSTCNFHSNNYISTRRNPTFSSDFAFNNNPFFAANSVATSPDVSLHVADEIKTMEGCVEAKNR